MSAALSAAILLQAASSMSAPAVIFLGAEQSVLPLRSEWLELDEASACGDTTSVSERLETLISLHSGRQKSIFPSLSVRGSPPHLIGEARLTLEGEIVFNKRVDADTCRDALDALLLSLEIFLDDVAPSLAQDEASSAPATSSTDRSQKAESRASVLPADSEDIDPFSLDELPPPSLRPQLPREERMLLAGPFVNWGALPVALGGKASGPVGALGGGLLARSHILGNWFFTGEVRMLAAPERYLNGVDYRFSSTELFLGPGLHWPLSRVFALRADGALVGKLTHVAYDAPRAAPRSLSRLSYGGAVHAGVTAFPWTSLLIEFRTGAEGLLARGRYLSRDRELIWQEPVISFNMGVFVGWASRSRTRFAEYSEAREGSESREQ